MIPEFIHIHEVVDIVITTLDARDPYTYEHSFRVALFSELISENMKLPQDMHERLHIAAHLHDIGKIGVSDSILNKTGKLTKAEMIEIQMHSRIGYNILNRLPTFKAIAKIVLHHHERIDGNGYPERLSRGAIPLESRIIAVADAFDAMTSSRSYRKGMPFEDAAAEINRHAGEQFDPEIVAHFNRVYREFPQHVSSNSPNGRHYAYLGHEELMHSRIVQNGAAVQTERV